MAFGGVERKWTIKTDPKAGLFSFKNYQLLSFTESLYRPSGRACETHRRQFKDLFQVSHILTQTTPQPRL